MKVLLLAIALVLIFLVPVEVSRWTYQHVTLNQDVVDEVFATVLVLEGVVIALAWGLLGAVVKARRASSASAKRA